MRYWKLKESERIIAVNKEVQMSTRWEEVKEIDYINYKARQSGEVVIGC